MSSRSEIFGLTSTVSDLERLVGDLAGIMPPGARGYYLQVMKGADVPLDAGAMEARLRERFKGAAVLVEVVTTSLLKRLSGCPVLTFSGIVMDRADVLRRHRERAEAAPWAAGVEEEAGATDFFQYGNTSPGDADQETRRLCWQARNAMGAVLAKGEWNLPRQGLRFGAALGKPPRAGMIALDGPGGHIVAHDGRRREWGFSRDQFLVDWEHLGINGQAPTRLLFDPQAGEAPNLPLKQGEKRSVGPKSIWAVKTNGDLVRLRTPPAGMAPEEAAVAELRFVIL